MPTITSLFGGHEPFRQLQVHMSVVCRSVGHMPELLAALETGDREQLKQIAKTLFKLEHEADTIKHDLRAHLPRTLFMPIDRRDLLAILHSQDGIADNCEDIAGLLLRREMPFPVALRAPLMELTERCVEVVEVAAKVIDNLDELLAVGFRGRVRDEVKELLCELNRAETATDRLERELEKVLFSLEDAMDPVSIILWHRIIEWTGGLADHAERVGNNLRLVIAR
jgi:predicted phosphate transport protein (TIGR00153 family)